MKIQKKIIVITVPICLICLAASLVLEFLPQPFPHAGYCSNVLLGVFASGLLVVVTAFVAYCGEKERYYKAVFPALNSALFNTEYLIIEVKENGINTKFREIAKEIEEGMDVARAEMWNFACFGKPNHRDDIIAVTLVRITKVTQALDLLMKEYVKHCSGEITESQLACAYKVFTEELSKTDLPQLAKCKAEIKEIIHSLSKDKKLNALIEKNQELTS